MKRVAFGLAFILTACGQSPDSSPATESSADATSHEVAEVAKPASGRVLFGKCAMCHTTGKGGPNGIGPNLNGVVGRAVASVPGFNYSAAMKAKGGVWDDASIDAFITAPREKLPGTRMTFYGVKDAAERKAIIEYLKTAE